MAKVFGAVYGVIAAVALVNGEVGVALGLGAYAAYLLIGNGRKLVIY